MLKPDMSFNAIVLRGVSNPSRRRTVDVGEVVLTRPMTSTMELTGVEFISLIVLKWKEWNGIEQSSSKEGSTVDAENNMISKPLLIWLYAGFGTLTVPLQTM